MPMPSHWIDKLFTSLELNYGQRFMAQWPGIATEVVKAHWAAELDGMESHADAIAHALDHLPVDHPPTVLQFRELCRRAPGPSYRALPSPQINKEVAAKALARAAAAMKPQHDVLYRQRQHMVCELNGERLGARQREFWRIALRAEVMELTGIDTMQKFSLDDLHVKLMAQGYAA